MTTTWARVGVIALVTVLALSAGSLLVGTVPVQGEGGDSNPTIGSVPRTTLVEMFTNADCVFCQYSDPAWVRLMQEYRDRPVVSLAWHVWWPGFDPFNNNDNPGNPGIVYDRVSYYDIDGAPTVLLDGGGPGNGQSLWTVGGNNKQVLYDAYKADFAQQVSDTTSLSMVLTGDLGPTTATVQTTVTAVDLVTQMNLRLRLILYEDQLSYTGGSYGVDVHPLTVREVVADEPINIPWGTTITRTHTFSIDPSYNPNALGIVAFVQTDDRIQNTQSGASYIPDYNAEVVQAADMRFVKPSVLVHRDDGVSPPDYEEYYEYELSQTPFTFDLHNTLESGDVGSNDVKAMPPAATMAEYGAVIWSTGPDSTNTLDTSERSAIAGYLDGYPGSVYVIGENIGDEIYLSQTVWFRSYLHSDLITADWGAGPNFRGIGGDPISGTWSSVDLTGVGLSPARIAPSGAGASAAFTYTNTAAVSAVKAQHDADSRVVFQANSYYEGTDPNAQDVMGKVLQWLDGGASPEVAVTLPAGGEVYSPGDTISITWDAVDVYIPANGVDLYYAEDSSNPTWVLVSSNEPNDGVYTWTAPNIASDKVRVRAVVRDGDGLTADADVQNAGDFTIGTLHAIGLNPAVAPQKLMSIRVNPINGAPASVFADVLGSIGTVRAYDPSDPADPWKTWHPTNGGDLTVITHKMAVWVEVTGVGTMNVIGSAPASTPILLTAGWNLVGYPSTSTSYTVAQLKAATGATRVEGFQTTAAPYYLRVLPDAYVLTAGEGYWVYVPSTVTWVVAG